jgi:cyclase
VLRSRIIPCLDVAGGRVVKGRNFVDLTDEGDPVAMAEAYAEAGADEICFLDITATPEGTSTMLDTVRRTAQNVFVPLTVGGGVRTVEDMRAVLRSGADKVAINSAAVRRPRLIADCARAFGSQCVVVAIDAKRTARGWTVHTRGGRTDVGIDALAWAERSTRLGAGELLVTSIDRDGTNLGYDLELLEAIARRTEVPLIASGGAGGPDDLAQALGHGRAHAVLAASIFHRDHYTIGEVKTRLAALGIPVRDVA